MARTPGIWMEFGDKRSTEMGVRVIKPPDRPRAALRGEALLVPGRSGDLWISDEGYEAVKLTVGLRMDANASRERISAWLTGSGNLRFSDEAERCYRARSVRDYQYERFLPGPVRDHFTVEFDCQPFKYEASPSLISMTAGGDVLNPGTVRAEPIITIYGSGDVALVVGGRILSIAGLDGSMVIDSEARIAYKKGMAGQPDSLQTGKLTGDWPTLGLDYTPVSWTGAVQRLDIQPNWRWL